MLHDDKVIYELVLGMLNMIIYGEMIMISYKESNAFMRFFWEYT